jgi:phage terminase large subunit-like protein
MANPNLGRRTSLDDLLADARRAKRNGGEELSSFLTEIMCIRVRLLDPAVDPSSWRRCMEVGDLSGARSRVALCLDVAPDALHATLAAAAVMPDSRVRVEVVAAWEGATATDRLRTELPGLLARVKPRTLGWWPAGPAAALAADLKVRPGWPPAGITVAEIRGDVAAVCMGLAEQVASGQLVHSDDQLLNAHVGQAERLRRGDIWVFSRKGEGHCDAAYAAAGAVHLARTMVPGKGRPRLLVSS